MKSSVSTPVMVVAIVLVLAVVAALGWFFLGERGTVVGDGTGKTVGTAPAAGNDRAGTLAPANTIAPPPN